MTPYYDDGVCTIHHGDCREILPSIGGVSALVTDPPYGIDYRTSSSRSALAASGNWHRIEGDDKPFNPSHLLTYPTVVLFGANNFADKLPASPGWLIWDKVAGLPSRREVGFNDSADCEMAWTNRRMPARVFSHDGWD